MPVRAAAPLLAFVLALAGCATPAVIEKSPSAVTVRYNGLDVTLDDATRMAEKACAQYSKTARLRKTAFIGLGLGERYAHFDCV
jgi:hypothetical protein